MKNKLSLLTFLSMVSLAAIFSMVIIYNMVNVSANNAKKTESDLRNIFIKRQKELISTEIRRLVERIGIEQAEVRDSAGIRVRNRVLIALEAIKGKPSTDVKNVMNKLFSPFMTDKLAGYYFVIDKNGKILYFSANHNLEGRRLSESGFSTDFVKLIKTTYTKGEALDKKLDIFPDKGKSNSVTFAKYNKKTGALVGAGILTEKLDAGAKHIILSELAKDRYGFNNSGYFFVITPDFKKVFHPDKAFPAENIQNLKDVDGKAFMQYAISNAAKNRHSFVQYKWVEPNTKFTGTKISYFEYIPDWQWVVATGFYFGGYKEMAVSEQRVIDSNLHKDLKSNILLIAALFTMSLLISAYIAEKLRKIENEQLKFLNDLEQYKNVLDSTSIISMTDPSGHIIYVNDKFCEISGYNREFLLGKKHNVMRHPDTPSELFKELWNTIVTGQIWTGIIKNLRADGTHFYHKVTIIPYKDRKGKITHYTSCSQDITELIENREKLQNVFNIDRLTGLGNRYKLLSDLESSKMPALAYIDIDRFHEINELYGMQAGDELLSIIAKKMSAMPGLAFFNQYRLHSDVFAIMAPHIDINIFISSVVTGMNTLTKEMHIIRDHEVYVTYRIGFSNDKDDTAAKADIALQLAKEQNREYIVYDTDNNFNNSINYEQNIKITKTVSTAIDEDRVVPFFQPIYDYSLRKITKYECLIRIMNTDGTVIPPAMFIDISKKTRLYPKLTKIMIQKSMAMFENLDYEFSINLSTEDLLNSETMDFLYHNAKKSNVMDKMVIEILETEQLTSDALALRNLLKLKKEGAKIAIDDFGTGYSNFDYLLKIQADYIKIDGSIIKLITKDERAADIVSSIVRYAKKMNLKTIAEFVSDKEIAHKARNMRVDYAQGYYFGKPESNPKTEPDNDL